MYRTKDGGKTWQKVLYAQSRQRARWIWRWTRRIHACIYAALWQIRRKPWTFESGGPGSGLFKIDRRRRHLDRDFARAGTAQRRAGAHRRDRFAGQPGTRVGAGGSRRTAAFSAATTAEATGPKSTIPNDLQQRAWYYAHIFADTKNADTVYVLNVGIYRSIDGGRTFSALRPPHGDNHGLWIAPNDPNRMIESNDGGATITRNGGARGRTPGQSADRAVLPRGARPAISRTTSTARSRTTRPCASPAGRRAAASRRRTGTTWAAARAAGSRPTRAIRRLSTRAPTTG